MKYGVIIYVDNMKKMKRFYAMVFGLEPIQSEDNFSILRKCNFELFLYLKHNAGIDSSNDQKKFPKYSSDVAPVFYANKELDQVSSIIEGCGGKLAKQDAFSMPDGIHCSGHDYEGNFFKVVLRKGQP